MLKLKTRIINYMQKINQSLLLILIFTLFSTAYADDSTPTDKPKWELGVGLGVLSLPHYRGSDQRTEYAAPIPYVRYNGKRLKVDKEGGRFYFYNGDDVKVDLSTAFSFPVDSKDNRARQGMPDIDAIIELGPRIQFNLYESDNKNLRFRLGLPFRAAVATDIGHTKAIGWVFSPYLQLRYYSGWESAISIGPVWASEEYHDYFYEVASEYATASRPAYDAKAGYSGSRITLTVSRRFNRIWFGFFAKYDNLNNAAFIDSPLIRQKDSLMMGFALSWVFKESKQRGHF